MANRRNQQKQQKRVTAILYESLVVTKASLPTHSSQQDESDRFRILTEYLLPIENPDLSEKHLEWQRYDQIIDIEGRIVVSTAILSGLGAGWKVYQSHTSDEAEDIVKIDTQLRAINTLPNVVTRENRENHTFAIRTKNQVMNDWLADQDDITAITTSDIIAYAAVLGCGVLVAAFTGTAAALFLKNHTHEDGLSKAGTWLHRMTH